jgi:PhnB protein
MDAVDGLLPMPDAASKLMPYLLYEDADRAIDWLTAAFGLRENTRQRGPDGRTLHAELYFGTDLILLGCPGPPYRNPKHLGSHTQYLYLLVEDVEAAFARAAGAGGAVIEQPADQPYGHRRCALEDPEGHRWYFAQPIQAARGGAAGAAGA